MYYPVYLDLKGQICVVVGGGQVAERKTMSLLEAGARVLVVSPAITDTLKHLAALGKITYSAQHFDPGCLEGARLAIAATDDPRVNAAVGAEARRRKVLVNVVDTPELCDFLSPAVVRRGPLIISISTSGVSPALARHLRQELAARYGPEYIEVLHTLEGLRRRLRDAIAEPKVRQTVLRRLLADGLVDLIRQGRRDLVEERVKQCLSSLSV